MAKYYVGGSEFEVDLTNYEWSFGDDCDVMISLYASKDGNTVHPEDIFTEEKLLKDNNTYQYINLYYADSEKGLDFRSLWLEVAGKNHTEIICSETEKEMFRNCLQALKSFYITLFHEDRDKKILDLEPQKVNAIVLALYQKHKLNLLAKEEVFAEIEKALQGKVSDLENEFRLEYVEKNKEKDIDIKEVYARFFLHDTNLDMKTYLDSSVFEAGIQSMLEDEVLRVERLRGSVTQGEAAVYCNGEKIVQYRDDKWLETRDGKLTNGFREIPNDLEPGNYGPSSGGWRSIESDFVFASAAMRQHPEVIYKAFTKDIRKLSLQDKVAEASKRFSKEKNEVSQKRGDREL